jgi:hypothetical protein
MHVLWYFCTLFSSMRIGIKRLLKAFANAHEDDTLSHALATIVLFLSADVLNAQHFDFAAVSLLWSIFQSNERAHDASASLKRASAPEIRHKRRKTETKLVRIARCVLLAFAGRSH